MLIFSEIYSKMCCSVFMLTLSAFCVSAHANPLTEDDANQVELSQRQAFAAETQLVDAAEGKNYANTLSFDFGLVDQMDDKQLVEDLIKRTNLERVFAGIKHNFTLRNVSKEDVTIFGIQSDCICIQAGILEGGKPKRIPYVVKAGKTVTLEVAFDHYSVYPGVASGKIDLYSPSSKRPLATLIMKGQVKGGVKIIEKSLDFGQVAGEGKSMDFTLFFDKRAPSIAWPAPIRLIPTSSYISVKNVDKKEEIMGVKILKDGVILPDVAALPNDLTLHFRAELSDKAPVGSFIGKINFIVEGSPYAAIVRGVEIPFKGEVVGHLRASPLTTLVLSTTPDNKLEQTTTIFYTAPIKAEQLKVGITNPNFVAELLPIEEKKLAKEGLGSTQEGMRLLKVTLLSTAPVGKHFGLAVVTNSANEERLELPISAVKADSAVRK